MFSPKLLLCALLFVVVSGLAQNVQLSKDFEVTSGDPYAVINAGSKEYVSLEDGTCIFAKMGGGIVSIQKYDTKAMKEVSRNTYEDLPKGAFFSDLVKLGSKVYYLYEVKNKKTKNFSYYGREINTTDATFKEPVELFQTSRYVTKSSGNGDLARVDAANPFSGSAMTNSNFGIPGPKFPTGISFDGSKLLISYRCVPEFKDDKKNFDLIGIYVFDQDMKKVQGGEHRMPYTEAQINNVGYAVTSEASAKILIVQREKKIYEMLTVDKSGTLSAKALDIKADELVRRMYMKEDDKGNIICAGVYANGIEFKMSFTGSAFVFNANGLMYFELDRDDETLRTQLYEFEDSFIKQNLSDRQKKKVAEREAKGKAGIADLILLHASVKEDGSSFFVCERQYARNEFYGPKQQLVYHFSNVVVIKVNTDGTLAWMRKLPKNQAGLRGGGQMSIAYMEGAEADYVAFVDNPKNIDLNADGGVPKAHKDGLGGYLTTYKIDHALGDLEKHTICDMNNINGQKAYQFKTFRILRAGSGLFILEIYIKGKKDNIVKFELK